MGFNKFVTGLGKLTDSDAEFVSKLKQYLYPILGCCFEVHKEMGPFLNEYMYQDALDICLEENGFTAENKIREFRFHATFHDKIIQHPHRMDFLVNQNVIIECKAVQSISTEHRQQLWNYMRLSGIRIGILYNFAPIKDQYEKYYFDPEQQRIFLF